MLLDAIARGRLYQVKFLLESGSVNVNVTDHHGQTPLMKAILLNDKMYHTRYKIVRLLLQHGAKVNLTDKSGKTALMLAVIRGQKDVTEKILKCSLMDIDLNAGDDKGNTALIHAALEGHDTITSMLIASLKRFSLDIDKKNHRGLTAMLAALRGGREDCARVLYLQGDASLTIRDPDNFMNASEWATHNQLFDFIELIEKTKQETAPLNTQNSTCNSADMIRTETPRLETPLMDYECTSRPQSPCDVTNRPVSRKRNSRLTVPRVMNNLKNQEEPVTIVIDNSRVPSPNDSTQDSRQFLQPSFPVAKENGSMESRSESCVKSSRSLLSSRRSSEPRLGIKAGSHQSKRCSSAKTEIQRLLSIYGVQNSLTYRRGYDPTSLPPSGMWPDPNAVNITYSIDNISIFGESDSFGESPFGFARRSALSNASSQSRRMSVFGANQGREGRRMSIIGQGNANTDRRTSVLGRKFTSVQPPPQRNLLEALGRKPGERRMSIAARPNIMERPTLRRNNTTQMSPLVG